MKTFQLTATFIFIILFTYCSDSANKGANENDSIVDKNTVLLNETTNETQLTVDNEKATRITGQLPEFNDYTMIKESDMGSIDIFPTKLYLKGPDHKNRYFLKGYIYEDRQEEYIVSIEELQKGTSYRIQSYAKDEERSYEFTKNTESGWWELTGKKRGYSISFADSKWMSDNYKRYDYAKISEIKPTIKTSPDVISDFIANSAGWSQVVRHEGNIVLLTKCEVKPLRLVFNQYDYDGTWHMNFSEGEVGLDSDLSIQAYRQYDYHIEIDYVNSLGDNLGLKTGKLFFKHYKVNIGGSDFEWNKIILDNFFNSGWERTFVPDDAQDRYDIVKIPCSD